MKCVWVFLLTYLSLSTKVNTCSTVRERAYENKLTKLKLMETILWKQLITYIETIWLYFLIFFIKVAYA